MSSALSLYELDSEHAELLPARDTLSFGGFSINVVPTIQTATNTAVAIAPRRVLPEGHRSCRVGSGGHRSLTCRLPRAGLALVGRLFGGPPGRLGFGIRTRGPEPSGARSQRRGAL